MCLSIPQDRQLARVGCIRRVLWRAAGSQTHCLCLVLCFCLCFGVIPYITVLQCFPYIFFEHLHSLVSSFRSSSWVDFLPMVRGITLEFLWIYSHSVASTINYRDNLFSSVWTEHFHQISVGCMYIIFWVLLYSIDLNTLFKFWIMFEKYLKQKHAS